MERSEKVFFVQEFEDGSFKKEALWCKRQNDNFVVDNIPFIAMRISLGDTIKAEFDENEKEFFFDDFVEVSGNSTIRIYFENSILIQAVRDNLLSLFGCESEVFADWNILAVNIPWNVSYKPVKIYLEEGEAAGKWEYEESCLVHDYE